MPQGMRMGMLKGGQHPLRGEGGGGMNNCVWGGLGEGQHLEYK